jgi:hypothetical protein
VIEPARAEKLSTIRWPAARLRIKHCYFYASIIALSKKIGQSTNNCSNKQQSPERRFFHNER